MERIANTHEVRSDRAAALVEFALVALIFFADRKGLIPFSKTPVLLLLGWGSLYFRKLRWRDVGLGAVRNWKLTVSFGIAAGALMEGFELFVSQPLLVRITGKPPNLSDFQPVIGNLKLAAIGLLLIWTLAAFGEEMVWRGYLMNRVADMGSRSRLAWTASLFAVNAVFGLAHAYQGITGIIDEGLMGILLGLIYLGARRNLFVPIIAHGVADTIDLLLIFFGKYPGM